MLPVLEAIADQEPPDGWTVQRELWVTLSPPDRELCDTWHTALDARGFDAFTAPQGKLTSRNEAHAHAIDQGADVIVAWDADAPPLSPRTLSALLEPFDDPDVVAVNGNPVSTSGGLAPVVNAVGGVEDALRPQMHGQLSAFRAEAWQRAGPFDDSIPQHSVQTVRSEEEFSFRDRLADLGRVVEASEARVENDTRRFGCRISQNPLGTGASDVYCRRRTGTTTFGPAEQRRRQLKRSGGGCE